MQGEADGQGDDYSCRGRGEQGEDDPAAQREQQGKGTRQHGVLPRVGQRAGEGNSGAEDGADGGGTSAVQEGPGPAVAADPAEPVSAEQNERK